MEKRILIAIDKFKGSLTSLQAAEAIKRGIERAVGRRDEVQAIQHSALSDAARESSVSLQFDIVPIADGGDGSADVIKTVMPGVEEIKTVAINPLGKEIETSYLLYLGSAQPAPAGIFKRLSPGAGSAQPAATNSVKAAFIEMAKVSGLALIEESERNPLITTTYGLGQLVKDAYLRGAREITLSIGGSATNDGGTGMLQALGFKFYNKKGELITDYMCGGLLGEISRMEIPSGILKECRINVVCDVTNPLLGSNGATYVYGPQKGATAERLQILESGMENYAAIAKSDMHLVEGAGAAGGVGFTVIRFLQGNLINGWKFFAEITNLKERIAWADVVISGEGKIDSQSFSGKVIDGIFTMANEYNKGVILFCGINELPASDYKVYALKDIEPNTQKCMQNAAVLLEQLAQGVVVRK